MELIPLNARIRTTTGKGPARRSRAQGWVPAVLYGNQTNLTVEVEARELTRVLAGRGGAHPMVELHVTDNGAPAQEHLAIISDIQRDIYQKDFYHVDFHCIGKDETIHTKVHLHFHGHPIGEKTGGVVDYMRRDIDVEGTSQSLPESLDVDITNLLAGHAMHVRDIPIPAGLTVLTDGDEIVVAIHAMRTADAVATAEEAAKEAPKEAVKTPA